MSSTTSIPTKTCSPPSELSSLVQLLRWRATNQPGRTAYTFLPDGETEGASLTYLDLDRQAIAIAAVLQFESRVGERALLVYPSGKDFVAAFFGCLYAGVTAVPVYPPDPLRLNRTLPRFKAIASDSQPDIALTLSSFTPFAETLSANCPELRSMRWVATDKIGSSLDREWKEHEVSSSTPAFVQYTSGSTAAPKGVIVSHGNILHNERVIQETCGHTERSTFVSWLPLYHDMGLIGTLLQPLYVGARGVIIPPQAFLERPFRWLQAISRYKAATSGAPNFAYDLCVRKITPEQRSALDLTTWTTAFNGAEPVRPKTLERFTTAFEPCGFRSDAFFPCYGLAEATLIVSGSPTMTARSVCSFQASDLDCGRVVAAPAEERTARELVSSGVVLGGQKVVIVNPDTLAMCRPNEVGEIWLAGPSVALGYWNRSEETDEVFNAFLADTGEGRFLRTGDLGFMIDGELFVTGRRRDLMIVRGRNHYPQDIELTVEQTHPSLRAGCGAAFSVDVGDGERLVIVQELDERTELDHRDAIEAIRREVSECHELQVYAIALIKAGAIPKTSSGKIQRHAARVAFLEKSLKLVAQWQEPPESYRDRDIDVTPVVESIESWLVTQLAARLKIDSREISLQQSITRYGIDSLVAAELGHSVEDSFVVKLPISSLLRNTTVAELARLIHSEITAGNIIPTATFAETEEAATEFGLSAGQKALWFLHQLAPESTAYNVSYAMRISGNLDIEALRRALQALMDRHASLRTSFTTVEADPIQLVRENVEVSFRLEEASASSEDLLSDRLSQEADRSFDLTDGPLLRVRLFTQSPRLHVLLFSAHHIVVDFWSLSILIDELGRLYSACKSDSIVSLPRLGYSYSDFVRWQSRLLDGPEGERLWSYWRGQLDGDLPTLDLSTDRVRPAMQTFRGASVPINLGPDLTARIKSLSQTSGASLYSTLLAAFQTLLFRYTSQEEVLVGSPATGRTRSEWRDVVGYFVNPLVIRTAFSTTEPFPSLLNRVRETVLSALEHQDYPFALLVERLQPERDPSRSPLFQAMMVFLGSQPGDRKSLAQFALRETGAKMRLGDLECESVAIEKRMAQFDLSLIVADADDRLTGAIEYNTDLFDVNTIIRLAGHFESLLESILIEPGRRIVDLTIMPESERRQVLEEWNPTGVERADETFLHELFERQAEQTPESVAVIEDRRRISYAELNSRANQLAHYLGSIGIGPEVTVGIFIERHVEMIVAILGTLKSGAAYVPIDPAYPTERQAFIIRDSRIETTLTESRLVGLLPQTQSRSVCLDQAWREIATQPCFNPRVRLSAENLAYVLYTSGSTGTPKGVAIAHRGARELTEWAKREYGPEDLAAVMAATSICFDLSVFEIMAPLTVGGKLVLLDNALSFTTSPAAAEVTLINTVPSAMEQIITAGPLPGGVRVVNLAGEPLSNDLAQRIHEASKVARVINLYGPTEDTTYSTKAEIERGGNETPAIGRPVTNTQVYIAGPEMELMPVGVTGELCIAGEGLARGYLYRADLTAENFVPNPFSATGGKRLYKTGDLARYGPDGKLQFLGRIDHQVKVRGFRVELGEIEYLLRRHDAIRDCVTDVRGERAGDRRIVAYVAAEEGQQVAPAELRAFLRDKLPEYMVPSAFIALESLPLTPNGKIDRRKLPSPDWSRPGTTAVFIPPRNPIEELVAAIWVEALGVEQVGIHDNFFDLGGHSLLAAKIVSRIQQQLSVELPLRKIFESQTVASLAENVASALEGNSTTRLPPIKQTERKALLPLSFGQQRLWFLDQLDPGNPAYNIPFAIRFRGPLDLYALHLSVNEILARHEALRMAFTTVGAEPRQSINPAARAGFSLIDLTQLPQSRRDGEATILASKESRRRFDLARGPLLRATLIRTDDQDHLAVFVFHHIASDGWSVEIFARELATFYESFTSGTTASLPDLPIQYVDYVHWQRELITRDVLEESLSYWKKQLAGSPPVLEFPADRARPSVQTFAGEVESFELPADLTGSLKGLCRRHGVTLFMMLAASFDVLLHRYTHSEDIIVGTPAAGRSRVEIEPLIGFFSNMLVLRSDMSGAPDFVQILGRVREAVLTAYAHQDLPFELLVEEVQPERSLSHTPLFQQAIALHPDPLRNVVFPGITASWGPIHNRTSKFDLQLNFLERDALLTGAIEYNTDQFDAATVARMARHLSTLIEGIIEDPHRSISMLPLLTESERLHLLYERNNSGCRYSTNECVHHVLEAVVKEYSAAVAVTFESQHLTYEQLNRSANQLAHHLRSLGVGPETPVAIFLDRSPRMVIAILAVLKTGGAYVPLDPAYPKQRLGFILEDTRSPVLITERSLADSLPHHDCRVIDLTSDLQTISRYEEGNPGHDVTPDNIAYVIYTSGSTGQPKGVSVTHSNAVRLFKATEDRFRFATNDVWTLFHSYAFDFSVWEIFGALMYGGRLVIVPYFVSRSPEAFYELLLEDRVTVVNQTPSAFRQLMMASERANSSKPSDLRLVILGGEALDPTSLKPWFDRNGDESPQLVNMFGITETTVHVTYREISSEDVSWSRSFIGEALPDLQMTLLDDQQQPMPIGVAGEICVGGAGLARGYLNDAKKTAEKFTPNPCARTKGQRLYRSGDLGRYLDDGDIEYVGRRDEQVKIRGYRIELGEIEAALLKHESVRECKVIMGAVAGERGLLGYVIGKDGLATSESELRRHLRERLPDHMVPAAFISLDRMPLTENGKLDRRALPEPDGLRPALDLPYVEPRTEIEKTIAGVWQQVLQLERVGAHDNFFDLGGNSLLMAQACGKLREALNRDLSMVEVFSYATVSSLSGYLTSDKDENPAQRQSQAQVETRIESMKRREQFRRQHRVRP